MLTDAGHRSHVSDVLPLTCRNGWEPALQVTFNPVRSIEGAKTGRVSDDLADDHLASRMQPKAEERQEVFVRAEASLRLPKEDFLVIKSATMVHSIYRAQKIPERGVIPLKSSLRSWAISSSERS